MKRTGISKKQLNALIALGDSVYKLSEGLANRNAFEGMLDDMNRSELIALSEALGMSQGEINIWNMLDGQDNTKLTNRLVNLYIRNHFTDALQNAAVAVDAAKDVIYTDPAISRLPKWLRYGYEANSSYDYLNSIKGN